MRRLTALFALFALLALFAGGMSACVKKSDEASACTSERCIVSLLQVIGNPAKYDGKRVLIVGYLVVDNHMLALYPTEENYKMGDIASSIGFHIPASQQTAFAKSDLYKYVQVDGVLNTKSHGFDDFRLADFVEVVSLTAMYIRNEKDRETEPAVSVDLLNK